MPRLLRSAVSSLLVASALAAVPAGAAAASGCPRRADEVRFDDGRLVVEHADRTVDPRTVRERWWACWRPSGRRTLIADRRRSDAAPELALQGIRRGRFVLLLGAGRLDVADARAGRRTARVAVTGVVRELVVTPQGRAAVLQDVAGDGSRLEAGDLARSCLLDAGGRAAADGSVFGDLAVRGEHLAWHREGVTLGADLNQLRCA
jgi:hypothetical protein